MMQQLPQQRVTMVWGAVEAMQSAVDRTITKYKEPEAFGGLLTHFRNTHCKLAKCKTKADAARAFLSAGKALHQRDNLSAEKAAMAKYWPTDTQGEVLDECLQLHGGYGLMLDTRSRKSGRTCGCNASSVAQTK